MHVESLEQRRLLSVVRMGDANEDGHIDGSDYSLIDNAFNQRDARGWNSGDFNGDGVIDGPDYTLMDNAFNRQDGPGIYAVRPGDDLQAALSILKPGDQLDILPGFYFGQFRVPRSGTLAAPITIAGFGSSQTFLDGTGYPAVWTSGNAVNISGIDFNGSANALQTGGVTIGGNSTFRDCVVEYCDAGGLNIAGSNVTVTNVIAQYNGELGIKSAMQSNISLINCISRNNNPGMIAPVWAGQSETLQSNGLWYVSPQFEAGGGKFAFTSNILFDGFESYNNNGHQFDFDISNYAVTIRNSSFHDAGWVSSTYEAIGLSIEISYGPTLITNNTFYNDQGDGLIIQTASNVQATSNVFTNSNFSMTNWIRGSDWELANIVFSGNTMNSSQIVTAGNMQPWNKTSIANMELTLQNNIWNSTPLIAVQWDTVGYSLARALTVLGIS